MNLDQLKIELSGDEGVRYVPYNDSRGIETIGIGHNMQANPLPTNWSFPLSDDQVDQLYQRDVSRTTALLDGNLPWWRSLDEVRQRAIANLGFNLGVHSLCTFHGFLGLLEAGQYDQAADDLAGTLWYSQVGRRGPQIVAMIRNGGDV